MENLSQHAVTRMQQHGIPRVALECLLESCAREEVQIVIPDSDPESRPSLDPGFRREDGFRSRLV